MFGVIPLSSVGLKSWGTECWVQTFCSSGQNLGSFKLPSDYRLLCWGWSLWWHCVPASSTLFDVCVCMCVCVCLFPFASCIVIAQPAFRFFFRGKNFVYRNTVSMGGGEFRILLNHSLEPQETSLLVQFSSVQSLSRVQLFVTPWIARRQVSLSITNSRSSLKLMSIESVMPSSHLILCHPLLLLPPVPPSMRVFSNESTLHMGGQSIGVSF